MFAGIFKRQTDFSRRSLAGNQLYGQNGEKRRRYEVVADNVHFVDGSKNNNSGDSGNPFSTPASGGANTGVAYSSGNTEDFEEIGGLDDLPF